MYNSTREDGSMWPPVWTKSNLSTEVPVSGYEQKKEKYHPYLDRTFWLGLVTANLHTIGTHRGWGWQSHDAISTQPVSREAVPAFSVNALVQCLPCAGPSSEWLPYIYSSNVHDNPMRKELCPYLTDEETEVQFLPHNGSVYSDGLCLWWCRWPSR